MPNTNDEPRTHLDELQVSMETVRPINKLVSHFRQEFIQGIQLKKTALKSDLKLKEVTILGVGSFYFPLNSFISETIKARLIFLVKCRQEFIIRKSKEKTLSK